MINKWQGVNVDYMENSFDSIGNIPHSEKAIIFCLFVSFSLEATPGNT